MVVVSAKTRAGGRRLAPVLHWTKISRLSPFYFGQETPSKLRSLLSLVDFTPVLDDVDGESPFGPVDSVKGSIAANP
jgi:hypothetical protein